MPASLVFFEDSKGRPVAAPAASGPVADTHAHLDMLDDAALALARCALVRVEFVISVVDPAENTTAFDMLATWLDDARLLLDEWGVQGKAAGDGTPAQDCVVPDVRLIAGVHPHNAKLYTRSCEQTLIECLHDPRTSAVGEIGLDYHYDLSPRDLQRKVFEAQLALANEYGLPVSLHLREAHADALSILREQGVPAAGCNVHCFNLDETVMAPFAELGCSFALGGPLTFKKSDDLRAAVAKLPLDKVMTETDSPYMTPVPCRGVSCEPAHTVFTAALLHETYAAVHPDAADTDLFYKHIYKNARGFFDRVPTAGQEDVGLTNRLLDAAQGLVSDEESKALVAALEEASDE